MAPEPHANGQDHHHHRDPDVPPPPLAPTVHAAFQGSWDGPGDRPPGLPHRRKPSYTRRNRRSDRPEPTAETRTPAPTSTATSAVNGIVRGAAISDQLLASGSSSATLVTPSTAIASSAPKAPTMMPSITNGHRMNQSVAPTSFITSTSRLRAYSDSRIVLAMSSTEAIVSSTGSA